MKQDTEVTNDMLYEDHQGSEETGPNHENSALESESNKVENANSDFPRTTYPNLMRDERLILEIRNFPCLYDRSHPYYKKADAMEQAWNQIREKCSWIDSNGEAIRLFEVLKKRYSKKKMDYKRAHVSSGESMLTRKTKIELDKYSFMNWMEPYIRFRTTKIPSEKVNKPDTNERDGSTTYRSETLDERLGKYVGEYLDKQSVSMVAGSKRPIQVLQAPVAYPYDDGVNVSSGPAIAGVVYYEEPVNTTVYTAPHAAQSHVDTNQQANYHQVKSTMAMETKRKRVASEIQQYSQSRQAPQQQHPQMLATGNDEISNDSRSSTPADHPSSKATDEASRNNASNTKTVYETKLLKDEDELFAALIVSEMKNLNDRMKYVVKHKISNVLFDALTEQTSEKKENTTNGN